MLKEIVEVEEVLGEKVKIRFERKKMCSCCSLGSVCGKGDGVLVIDKGDFSLEVGEKVEIAIDEKRTLLASILTFLIPSVIFIFFLFFFRSYGELRSFFLALSLVCIYYIILKQFLRIQAKKFSLQILRKV